MSTAKMSIPEAYASAAAYATGTSGVVVGLTQPMQQAAHSLTLQDWLGCIGAVCIVVTTVGNLYYKRRADQRAAQGHRGRDDTD